MAARGGALLKYLRVKVQTMPTTRNPINNGLVGLSFNSIRRRFSEEVRGTFLDKSEVTDRVVNVVKNFQKVDPSKVINVTPNAHFQNDLGLDSLDSVEMVMALEEEFQFEIPDNEADKINSISLAIDFISSHPQAK
ncbi:ACYL CARRIER PROTEIN 2 MITOCHONDRIAL [Salix koriyanagi]|uniref:Acyl carrier protein n=1 Tax=Salix koriyanagi TaxID=2511006 RepID=A0A9Q0W8N3_9ROSI|nr:ACYL CARRIER PROTEIN 2 MITOCHONDRIAL [Salix koriyanagi]